MDLAQVLMELWRRRGWVAAGAIVALVVALSTGYRIGAGGLEKRALALGTADTQLLIDTPKSALTDLGVGFDALTERAGVYARFMTTRPVRRAIARRMDVPEEAIVTRAPLPSGLPRSAREPDRARRTGEVAAERRRLVLTFTNDPGSPTVRITAEAAEGVEAKRLADAAADGFVAYVAKLQRTQGVPAERRVAVRQLGHAEGATVAEDVSVKLALLAFGGTFVFWCLLVLGAGSVAQSMRALRAGDPRPDASPGGAPS